MNESCFKENEEKTCLLGKLLHAAGYVEDRLDAALSRAGLSLSKFAVLDKLTKAGEPLLLTRLAQQIACVKSNVTQLVDRLESDGLVQRKDAPEDRRSVLAAITDEGQRRYEAGDKELTEAVKDLLKSYTKEELETLNNLLSRLNKE